MSHPELLDPEELTVFAQHALAGDDLEKALCHVKRAMQQSSTPSYCLALGAKIYARMGLLERSAAHFAHFLELNPDKYHERFQWALVQFRLANPEAALVNWERVLEADATHPPSLFCCAYANAVAGARGRTQRFVDVLLSSADRDNLFCEKARWLRQQMQDKASGKALMDLTWPDDLPDRLLFR